MQSGTLAATLLCATAPAAKAGHEVPYYPSFYPQEIRVEPLDQGFVVLYRRFDTSLRFAPRWLLDPHAR